MAKIDPIEVPVLLESMSQPLAETALQFAAQMCADRLVSEWADDRPTLEELLVAASRIREWLERE
jgi:hypothetical protein